MLMTSDQDGLVKLSGGGPWVIVEYTNVGDMVTGDGGLFTVATDLTGWIFPGDMLYLTGATDPDNDGPACVINTTFAAGLTTIEVFRPLGFDNALANEVFGTAQVGAGAANLMTKFEPMGIKYNIDAADDFTVAGAPGQIEIAEDLSFLEEFDQILIEDATTAANNQIATVVSATFVAPDTTIVVEEAVVVEAGTANTTLQPIRTSIHARLTANIPVLWTLPAGFVLNPCLEDITTLLVSNDHATAAATFRARFVTGIV